MSIITIVQRFMLTARVHYELELLKRHIIILKKVIDSGPIGIMKLSTETGIPDHRVRYSLRVLEQKGLITPSSQGAVAAKTAKEAFSEFKIELEKIQEAAKEIRRIGFE